MTRDGAADASRLQREIQQLKSAGSWEAAIPVARELVDCFRRQFGDRHPAVATTLTGLAEILEHSGAFPAAAEALNQANEVWRLVQGERHPAYAESLARLAELHLRSGKPSEAATLLQMALDILMAELGAENSRTVRVRAALDAACRQSAAVATPAIPAEIPGWRTARVFLSSTFRDMHAERDHLVKVTFPRLRQWCEARRLHLVDIDLRWGVTREEAENGRAIDICLQEIDGSRPFFVCMLGERYGWVPTDLPAEKSYMYHGLVSALGLSITHLEILHATESSLAKSKDGAPCQHAFFYMRDAACIPDPDTRQELTTGVREGLRQTFFESDPAVAAKLQKLKTDIQHRFGAENRVRTYSGRWDWDASNPEIPSLPGRLTDLETFGECVEDDLRHAIEVEFAGHLATASKAMDPLAEERVHHEAFAEHLLQVHIPRREIETALDKYLSGPEERPLLLSGAPGSGKSAILAHWSKSLAGVGTDVLVFTRFVGASPASTNFHALLTHLAAELIAACGLTEKVAVPHSRESLTRSRRVPTTAPELLEQWSNILTDAGTARRIVIILDGLDQFDQSPDALIAGWLLRPLPAGVKVVASVMDPGQVKAETADPGSAARPAVGRSWIHFLRSGGMPELAAGVLSDEDCHGMLQGIPNVFAKSLDAAQVALLMANRATRNPLFLQVALEELRLFGSFERLEAAICNLPELDDPEINGNAEAALEAVFGRVLARLEGETNRIAPGLVPALFRLLASAREGLQEPEMSRLLADELTELSSPVREGAIQAVLRQLRRYLARRGGKQGAVVGFYHRSLWQAACRRYLGTNVVRRQTYQILARYFEAQPNYLPSGAADAPPEPNTRKTSELVWQLLAAAREAPTDISAWQRLEVPLSDIGFIAAKCETGGYYDLQTEYTATLAGWPDLSLPDPFLPPQPVPDALVPAEDQEPGNASTQTPAYSEGESIPDDLFGPDRGGEAILATMRHTEEEARSGKDVNPMPPEVRVIHAFGAFVSAHGQILQSDPPATIPTARNQAATGPVSTAGGAAASALPHAWIARNPRPPEPPAQPIRLRTFGADGQISSVTLTPDGRIAAAGCPDGRILVWDVASGVLRQRLQGRGSIVTVALSADGRTLAAASRSSSMMERLQTMTRGSKNQEGEDALGIWDVTSGRCLHELGATGAVSLVVASAGDRLIAAMPEGISVWNMTTWGQPDRLGGHAVRVAVTADGRAAFVLGKDHLLRIWNVTAAECRRAWPAPESPVNSMVITPDSRFVAVCCGENALVKEKENAAYIWDCVTGRCLRVFRDHAQAIHGVALSADGKILLTAGADEKLRAWDVRTGSCIRCLELGASIAALEATADCRSALILDEESMLHFCDVASGRPGEVLPGHEGRAATLRYLDPYGGKLAFPDELLAGTRNRRVNRLAVAPGWAEAVSAGGDATVRVWDPLSGQPQHMMMGHMMEVADVALNAGGLAVSAGMDSSLRLWDSRAGHCLKILTVHGGSVHAVEFVPGNRWIVSGANASGQRGFADHSLRVTDLVTGHLEHILNGHTHWVMGVGVTPDGRVAVSASSDHRLRVWDLQSGDSLQELRGHSGPVWRVAVAPDGRSVVSAGADGTVRWWNLATGRCLRTVEAHRGDTHDVAFSTDNQLVVSAGEDHCLRFWDLASGKHLAAYHTLVQVCCVTGIDPLGRLACGTADGQLHFLRLMAHQLKTPIATAVLGAFRYNNPGGSGPSGNPMVPAFEPTAPLPGDTATDPGFCCPWCGAWSSVASRPREALDRWAATGSSGKPPCLVLPERAFNDPELAVDCTACGRPVRLNPFLGAAPRCTEPPPYSWRGEPSLQGRFHPEYPDDIQVVVHDGLCKPAVEVDSKLRDLLIQQSGGDPARSTPSSGGPELMWVRIHGRKGEAYRGLLMNQPSGLPSLSQGDPILFVHRLTDRPAPSTAEWIGGERATRDVSLRDSGAAYPYRVTDKYLAEMAEWVVEPCTTCGMPDAFDAPSDLLKVAAPDRPPETIQRISSFCPFCGGPQTIRRRKAGNIPVEEPKRPPGTRPSPTPERSPDRPWWKRWGRSG